MTRDWELGDVAFVTLGQHVYPGSHQAGDTVLMCRGYPKGRLECWRSAETGVVYKDAEVAKARPALVIDPDDRSQVERLLIAMTEWAGRVPYSDMRRHGDLTEVDAAQAALRSLVAPVRPTEPTGLGAVVEDDDARLWVRTDQGEWTSAGDFAEWSAIDAGRIVAEGVTS